ncbi:hypothetical protein RJ639_046748 [Escallonia herrerae]|uniref:Gag protein n=1 Tax=Escallonia herrerae TaxID=1293975 RepID=A0AA89B2E5_9ASTE|nr:hypothetical protein RJ639_046748 [Escallonia herrerae]
MATSETNSESGPINPNVQHGGGTVYATPYVAPTHGSVGLGERPEKFNGKDFKRFLQEDAPDLGENPDRQTVAAVEAWKHSDFLCKNYILNGLDNALYNVYSPMVNAKALWESLERKYKTEDAGSKKFVVGKFLDFKMVDSKTVISQVQEFQLILHDIHAEGMVLGESFQVAALIEKLPLTWKDFKNYLKHKRKEMKLEDLIVRLRIEEDNRQSEKKAGNYHQEAKANVVEQEYSYGAVDRIPKIKVFPSREYVKHQVAPREERDLQLEVYKMIKMSRSAFSTSNVSFSTSAINDKVAAQHLEEM